MLEESEASPELGFDPSMNRHRPGSEKSQDISHVLASMFKDLYTREITGKDTFANLTKTRRGRSDYHDKYVEELQQARSEYTRRLTEVDMLKNHIIQARVQASAKESQALERVLEEAGQASDQLGPPPVRSAFVWCVDNNLLKKNNLISPQDYRTEYAPLMEAPAVKSNPHYTNPTLSYNMHVCREPQDDGYTVIPSAEKDNHSLQEESECNLTLELSSDISTKRKTHSEKAAQVRSRPKWMDEPSAKNRAEERDKLQKLKDRHNFLRNPRFLPPDAQQGGKSLILPRSKAEKMAQGKKAVAEHSPTDGPIPVFLANPSVVFFTGYTVGQVYETTVELKNLTATSRHVRVIPPTTPYFSIGLGRFPGEGGMVAPGMSCRYTVRFAPDSLADYEDFIMVETLAQVPLLVPIEARRPPPVLTLPRVLDCGYCLVGGVKFVEFLCHNDGLSSGTFCIIPKSQWPASNLRSVVKTSFAEQPPFAVSPSLFELLPGQATVVEVVFFPTAAEKCSQVFTIVCDNCQVKDVTIQGEGQVIALELVSVSGEKEGPAMGEIRDLTAEHFVRFSPCNPHSVQQKKLVIRNNAHLELPYHWQIMKPNLQPLLPGQAPDPSHIQFHLAKDDVFHVSPLTGLLSPCQDHEFLLTYSPKELKDYHSVYHLVMRDVPELPKTSSANSALQTMAPRVNDIIVMEIEAKGSTEPYKILLEPYAIHIPGELYIGNATHRRIKMWNHSKSCISFQWERMSGCHILEVEPSAGDLEVNECFDLDLVVTGGKPERVVSSLLCHIQHHPKPIALAIEVTFKGPVVSLNVPSLDLGLLRLGQLAQTTVLLTNTSQLEAPWTLEERRNGQKDHLHPSLIQQISVEPCRGVLPPLASCSVDVLLSPDSCQHFDTILELAVENGTGCHLSVQADVQSPQVCLLSCELVFSDLYMGVPAKGLVTLFNQTLLPAHFTWMSQLQGKQASLCTATFNPSSDTLGPNATMEITVTFTPHTDLELTEVAAVCEVQGMESPLVLGFYSKAKGLSVSYSLPSDRPASGDLDQSSLVLDFGDDVILKRPVTKQLVITNNTAIPAPFTMEAEYFTGHAPAPSKPTDQSQKRYTKKPLHSVQAKKLEEKAHDEFVSSLLAHGKGAVFFVLPESGMLGPFETQTIDITAFTDMWGEYRDHLICRVGDLEPKLLPMQMTVTGCPLYFQMIGPQPDSQNQGPIVKFGTHVSGGDTMSRSLRINNPSPYDIRMDWETYNIDQKDRKLLDVVVAYGDAFPLKDADGNEVVDGALALSDESVQPTWDRSHTSSSEGISSSPGSKTDTDEEDCMTEEKEEGEEEENCLYQQPPRKKLFSVYIRPHRGSASDYPYCITPQQIVIPAKGSGTIHVSFTPLTLSVPFRESKCVGLALGFMSLDSQMAACIPGKVGRAQGLDLEPVRLDLHATVKPALLSVQLDEDEGVLEFHASASDLLKEESENELSAREFDVTQTFQLQNASEMPLHFSLETQPPFYVLRPQPRAQTSSSSDPPTSNSCSLVLQPQHKMQVKVAFRCSLPLLDYATQPEGEVPPTTMLVPCASGQRKLKFQQSLLLHYSNNSLQTVPLCAYLDLATLSLSRDCIDFGTCYVGQKRAADINLYSHGACSYWKAVIIESDEESSHVFKVTPDCGVLGPLDSSANSGRQPLQISFTASEEREFKATVIVQGVLVRPSLSLQVQGRGSFDERFMSSLASL